MDDLISRQAAIDALCSACGYDCDKSEFVYDAPQDEQVILCPEHYALTSLPSAEPEIVRCKDCKHYIPGITCVEGHYNGCDAWLDNGNEIEVAPDDYCSYAERKDGD